MEPLGQLREWGYEVTEHEIEGSQTVHVEGFGISGYYELDELVRLADPVAHAERERQEGETFEETMERLRAEEESS